jgi:hypothetical protein
MWTLPIQERLKECRNILVAGAGGGYDVLCGLPLFVALESAGHIVHLASLSSVPLNDTEETERVTETLWKVTARSRREGYFPEAWLSRWFAEQRGREIPVWSFMASGVIPYYESYAHLAEHLSLDAIVLVDGGVDSLLRGDEYSPGTPLWDALTIAAVHCLDTVPVKVLAATAFGAERWDGLCHAQALERIADLTRADALLGVTTLLQNTPEGEAYRDAARYVLENQADVQRSVVTASLLAAMDGVFGERPVGPDTLATPIWLSPLLCLYWFFELDAVARQKQFLPGLLATRTVSEAADRMQRFFDTHPRRPWENIPI